MPAKRKYRLSDAALAQRRAASASALQKRAVVPDLRVLNAAASLPVDGPASVSILDDIAEAARRMAQNRWLNPASEAHKQAARINGRNGGRRPVPTPCVRCKVICDSAAKAKAHCNFR